MSSSSEAPAPPVAPKVEVRKLGKYELQKQLGAGGMGTVYLAKDTQLKRLVALKVLPQDKAKNPTLVRRFYAEAQACAQLRNDHIVSIYENGEADGHLFIAMEYVDGTDLHELIRKRGKIPVKRSIEIIKQVTEALQHAAEHNIVHRDIKPSNLLVRNDGVVKLTDLGLARSIDDTLETDITRAGTTVGTVDYMSPEQGRSSKLADIRSDIYSLGCTWYHMLTGKPPFSEGSMTNKLQAHATKPPPDARAINDKVTEAMVAVLQRMMAKKPEDRYQTPNELMKDLQRPSLTRGGVVEEVLSAISEESEASVELTKPEKRGGAPGQLPPKKQVQAEDEKEPFDWDTVKPYLWSALALLTIVGLGTIVAGFSGGLDFGGGKIERSAENQRPQPGDGQTVVQGANGNAATPQTGSSAPAVSQPEFVTTTTPDGATADPAATSAPTKPDGTGDSKTVASPSSTAPPNSTSPANPNTPAANSGSSGGKVAQTAPTLDAEKVPDWSAAPPTRAGKTNPGPNTTPSGSTGSGTTKTPGTTSPGSSPANPKTPTPSTPAGNSGKSPVPAVATPTLKSITVGAGKSGGNHFTDLGAALSSLPREGAVIQFTSAGPFTLPEIALRQIERVSLIAGVGLQPIVIVRPAAGQATAGLRLTEGILDIEGIHFTLDRAAFAGSDPVSMIASIDGQVTIRQSTFTVWGTGTVPVRALHVDSLVESSGLSSALEPRVLIDQVSVRGEQVTALAITRPNADVVVRESLFASGSQPTVTLSGKLPDGVASLAVTKPRRALRFLQSTLFGRKMVFQVSGDGAAVPPATAIFLLESICATSGPSADAVLLDASQWPLAATDAPGAKFLNLAWGMKESAALGFGRLAELGPDAKLQNIHLDGWQTLWNRPFTTQQFPATIWPAKATTDLASLAATDFERESLPTRDVVRADNSPSGCDAKSLLDLSAGSRRWLMALAAKPSFPTSTFGADNIVKVDISKQQDLGSILQGADWPAGTVIELTGSGTKLMTPVKLTDRTWKIVGKPQDGGQLTLTPKTLNGELPALIVAERGCIELENLRFQLPSSKKTTLTSLIAGHGAQLTLDHVSVVGVWSDPEVLESLVRWTGSSASTTELKPHLAARDCYFTGGGNGLRIELGSSPAYLKNCLFVNRSDAIDVRILPVAKDQPFAPLVAEHLTISAGQGSVHVGSTSGDASAEPHRFYFDRCVFAAPVLSKNDDNTATLLSLVHPQADLGRVEWWGVANGVAPEVVSFIRPDQTPKPSPYEAGLGSWQSAWTPEQDQRLLTGTGGVMMPDFAAIKPGAAKPSQFALHAKSKAVSWDDGGLPIGADLKRLETPAAAPKPKEPTKPKTAPTTPAKTQPDF